MHDQGIGAGHSDQIRRSARIAGNRTVIKECTIFSGLRMTQNRQIPGPPRWSGKLSRD